MDWLVKCRKCKGEGTLDITIQDGSITIFCPECGGNGQAPAYQYIENDMAKDRVYVASGIIGFTMMCVLVWAYSFMAQVSWGFVFIALLNLIWALYNVYTYFDKGEQLELLKAVGIAPVEKAKELPREVELTFDNDGEVTIEQVLEEANQALN